MVMKKKQDPQAQREKARLKKRSQRARRRLAAGLPPKKIGAAVKWMLVMQGIDVAKVRRERRNVARRERMARWKNGEPAKHPNMARE